MQFVDHAWVQFKGRMSIRLAAGFAALCAAIVAYPTVLLGALAYFPGNYRAFAAGGVFVVVLGVPTLTALIKQPKLAEKIEQAKAASTETPDAE